MMEINDGLMLKVEPGDNDMGSQNLECGDMNYKVLSCTCQFCDESFRNLETLRRHIYVRHHSDVKYNGEHSPEIVNQNKPIQRDSPSAQENKRAHVCDVCQKGFTRKYHLQSHMKTHSTEAPLECPHCSKRFKYNASFKEHIERHLGSKPFSCEVCGKAFTSKSNYNRHMRVHSDEKPHTCGLCGKGFKTRSDLNVHMTYHSGAKRFTCSYCEKSFAYNRDLLKHVRTHTGEKPFGCDQCGKRFAQVGHLQTHMQKHTSDNPFSCEVCGVTFRYINSYRKHVVKHGRTKTYRCGHCGEKFDKRSDFNDHIRYHMDKGQLIDIQDEEDNEEDNNHDLDTEHQGQVEKGIVLKAEVESEHSNSIQPDTVDHSDQHAVVGDPLLAGSPPVSCILTDVKKEPQSTFIEIDGDEKIREEVDEDVTHQRYHGYKVGDSLNCYICGVVFLVEDALQQHIDSHIRDELKQRKQGSAKTV